MKIMIFNVFKKKKPAGEKTGLDEAKNLNLITEEEFLILKEKRASEEVKEFYDRRKKKVIIRERKNE